jgi:phage host-nuclease inhibitor protein Gam
MTTLEIISLCFGTSGGSALFTAWYTKKKTSAEADKIIGEAYGSLVRNLQEEIHRLSDRVTNQEKRELRYLEMISSKDQTELSLRVRIKDLENEIKSLASEITAMRTINNNNPTQNE